MFALASLSLKGRALRALAEREHSRAELVRKLSPFETQAGELQTVLDDLASKGFLNEQRVAESVAYRRGAKLGAARVVQELRAKGVEADAVANVAAQLKFTELARAREVWRKKFGGVAHDAGERNKQLRFLASRGFATDVIRRVVGGDDEAGNDGDC